jgi:AcrR family transcriptional regulator
MESESVQSLEVDTRQRILTSALEVFLEKGYAAATTRLIASHAGVNEVTLFRHFGNKPNLLVAIIDRFSPVDNLKRLLAEQLTGDFDQDIQQIAAFLVDVMSQQSDIMPLVLYEAHQIPELREKLESIPREMLMLLIPYFEQQARLGNIRKDLSPFLMARSFFFLHVSLGRLAHAEQERKMPLPITPEVAAGQLLELFLRGAKNSNE